MINSYGVSGLITSKSSIGSFPYFSFGLVLMLSNCHRCIGLEIVVKNID